MVSMTTGPLSDGWQRESPQPDNVNWDQPAVDGRQIWETLIASSSVCGAHRMSGIRGCWRDSSWAVIGAADWSHVTSPMNLPSRPITHLNVSFSLSILRLVASRFSIRQHSENCQNTMISLYYNCLLIVYRLTVSRICAQSEILL